MRCFSPGSVPIPKGWEGYCLPKGQPLDLEIGVGAGMHAVGYAEKHPSRFLVAIESTQNRFQAFQKRLDLAGRRSNLLPVRANAIHWITHFALEASLSRVFLFYPNPYPKTSQANKRWHRMPFMGYLKSRMKPAGSLYLASNQRWYLDEAKEFMQDTWGFHLAKDEELVLGKGARTHFEKKYMERGESCWELAFRKG